MIPKYLLVILLLSPLRTVSQQSSLSQEELIIQSADSLFQIAQIDEAISMLTDLSNEQKNSDDWEGHVKTSFKVVGYKIESGSIDEASNELITLKQLIEAKLPNAFELRGQWQQKKADTYFYTGNLDSARHYFAQSLTIYEEADAWPQWGDVRMGIAASYYFEGQLETFEEILREAEEIAQTHIPIEDPFWGNLYNLYGVLFIEKGNYEASIENALKEVDFYYSTRGFLKSPAAYDRHR